MADDVEIRFGANTEALEEGSKKAGEALKEVNEHVKELKEAGEQLHETFDKVLEFAGIEIGLDALKEWVASTAELGEQMERAGAMLGVTGSQASELSGMAKLTGTSFEGLEHAVERMDLQLASLDSKSSHAAEALRVLGINSREFTSASTVGQINIMAEAFSRFADGPQKTAAAMALLGRAGAEMLPFLDRGKEGIEELHDVLQRTGAVMSNEMVESFAKVNEHLNEMRLAWQGLSNEIFDVLKSPIDAAIVEFTRFVESLRPDQIRSAILSSVQTIGAFGVSSATVFVTIRSDIQQVAHAFEAFAQEVEKWAALAKGPIDKLADAFERLRVASNFGMTVKTVGQPDTSRPVAGSGSVQGSGPYGGVGPRPSAADDPGLQAALDIAATKRAIESLTRGVTDLFGKDPRTIRHGEGEGGPAEGGAKPSVPQMQLGGAGGRDKDTAAKDAEEAFNSEVQAAKDAEASIAAALEERLKLHQLTMTQWAQQSVVALDHEQDAIQDAALKAIASQALSSQQRTAILNKEEHDFAEIMLKEQKDLAKAAEEMAKSFQAAGDKLADILNSQLDPLLKGTESIRKAFQNMTASVIEDLAKMGIKSAAEHAALGVMGLFGGGEGSGGGIGTFNGNFGAPPTGLGSGGGGSGSGGIGGGPFEVLTAALSLNTLSTLANTIATDAAAIGKFFGFAEGTDYVQNTGLALLHEGEKVTPAHLNPSNPRNSLGSWSAPNFADIGHWGPPASVMEAMNRGHPGGQTAPGSLASALGGGNGSGGGGDTHHSHTHNWNISGADPGGLRDFFRDNAHHIMAAFDKGAGGGGHLHLRNLNGQRR